MQKNRKRNRDKLEYPLKTKKNPASFSNLNGRFYGPKTNKQIKIIKQNLYQI